MSAQVPDARVESYEDILSDSFPLLGDTPIISSDVIKYGSLVLTVAPKEGKANTLLADHLFSPALFLAERIERKLLIAPRSTVLELGAGTALPSLLLSSLPNPPSLIVVTDYPDDIILGNLRQNVDRNNDHVDSSCRVQCSGYAWGADAQPLLSLLPDETKGFDVIIMSDLLHFDSSHDVLIGSVVSLLAKTQSARLHIAAGNYTLPHICDHFLSEGANYGLAFEEILPEPGQQQWLGKLDVSGLDRGALSNRKAICRYWIGCWQDSFLDTSSG